MANFPIINNLRIVPRDSEFLNRKLGSRGEIFFDRDTKTLRIYDGDTVGGIQLSKSDLSNVSNSDFLAKATAAGVGSGGGGNTTVTVGTSTPSSPENGNLWLDTNSGILYVYINDGDTSQWIQPAYPSFSGNYSDLTNKPVLATVAGTGNYSDLINKPIVPTNTSQLYNDADFISESSASINISVVGDDSVVLVDVSASSINTHTLSQISATNGQALVWNDGNSRWQPGDVAPDVGSFSFTGTNIDTTDSSAITVTPAIIMQSDLTVENDLVAERAFVTDLTLTGEISSQGSGTPEILSDNEINLSAGTRVDLITGPIRMARFTTSERDALVSQNGDVIYNTTLNKFQGYENGSWTNLI